MTEISLIIARVEKHLADLAECSEFSSEDEIKNIRDAISLCKKYGVGK